MRLVREQLFISTMDVPVDRNELALPAFNFNDKQMKLLLIYKPMLVFVN